jgi:hypothetical protein
VPLPFPAYFTTHQMINNASVAQFNKTSLEALTKTIQCVLSGQYSIGRVNISYVNITLDSSLRRRRSLTTTTAVALAYNVEYYFPEQTDDSPYFEVVSYFQGLTTQFTESVNDGHFTLALNQYCSSGCALTSPSAVIPPSYVGPFLLTNAPTPQPVSASSSGGIAQYKTIIIIGVSVVVVLLLCCIAVCCFFSYFQSDPDKESATNLDLWIKSGTGEINLFHYDDMNVKEDVHNTQNPMKEKNFKKNKNDINFREARERTLRIDRASKKIISTYNAGNGDDYEYDFDYQGYNNNEYVHENVNPTHQDVRFRNNDLSGRHSEDTEMNYEDGFYPEEHTV